METEKVDGKNIVNVISLIASTIITIISMIFKTGGIK